MKLIPWHIHDDVEAYTTTKELGDISLNNPNILQVLQNRQELASLLNTDLEHMVAPRQTHSINLKQVYLKDGGTNMLKQTDTLYEVDATYTKDKELYLLSFHADCTPILVYCKDHDIENKYDRVDWVLTPLVVFFNNTLDLLGKKNIIKEYGFEEIEREVTKMCNLGEMIAKENMKKGQKKKNIEHIRNLMNELPCSMQRAMDILKLTTYERKEIERECKINCVSQGRAT